MPSGEGGDEVGLLRWFACWGRGRAPACVIPCFGELGRLCGSAGSRPAPPPQQQQQPHSPCANRTCATAAAHLPPLQPAGLGLCGWQRLATWWCFIAYYVCEATLTFSGSETARAARRAVLAACCAHARRTTTLPTVVPLSMCSIASGMLSRPSKTRLSSTHASSLPCSRGRGWGRAGAVGAVACVAQHREPPPASGERQAAHHHHHQQQQQQQQQRSAAPAPTCCCSSNTSALQRSISARSLGHTLPYTVRPPGRCTVMPPQNSCAEGGSGPSGSSAAAPASLEAAGGSWLLLLLLLVVVCGYSGVREAQGDRSARHISSVSKHTQCGSTAGNTACHSHDHCSAPHPPEM